MPLSAQYSLLQMSFRVFCLSCPATDQNGSIGLSLTGLELSQCMESSADTDLSTKLTLLF